MTGILIAAGIYFAIAGIIGIILGLISRGDYKVKTRYAMFWGAVVSYFVIAAVCFSAAFA